VVGALIADADNADNGFYPTVKCNYYAAML